MTQATSTTDRLSAGHVADGLAHLIGPCLRCPICVDTIQDAFVTTCGHTFCYQCITTHLRTRFSCPSCSHYLTADHIYPNFLLNKILSKVSAAEVSRTARLVDHIQQVLEDSCTSLRADELQAVISVLEERRQHLLHQEETTSLHLMLLFLLEARQRQQQEVQGLQQHLDMLEEDLRSSRCLYDLKVDLKCDPSILAVCDPDTGQGKCGLSRPGMELDESRKGQAVAVQQQGQQGQQQQQLLQQDQGQQQQQHREQQEQEHEPPPPLQLTQPTQPTQPLPLTGPPGASAAPTPPPPSPIATPPAPPPDAGSTAPPPPPAPANISHELCATHATASLTQVSSGGLSTRPQISPPQLHTAHSLSHSLSHSHSLHTARDPRRGSGGAQQVVSLPHHVAHSAGGLINSMLADLAQPWQQQQEQPLAGQQAEIRQEEERQHAQQQLGQRQQPEGVKQDHPSAQQQQEGVEQDHPSAQQQPPPQNQQQAVGLKEEVLSRTEHQPGLPGDSQQPCNGKQGDEEVTAQQPLPPTSQPPGLPPQPCLLHAAGPEPTQCLLQLPPSHSEHSPSSPSPQLFQLPAAAPPPSPSQPASLPASHLNLLPPARPLQLPQPAQQPQPLQQIVPPVDSRVREVKRQRVLERFGELERRYLQLRRDQGAVQGGEAAAGQAPPPYLHQLSEVIEAATHFGRMTVLSEIQAGSGGGGGGGGQAGRAGGEGGRAGGGMVSALEFNTEDSVLASCTAQRACLWQYSQLLASSTKPPQPLLELPSRSSLTCLTWSKHQTSCLITSDAEGQVHLHDTHTQQRLSDFAAHAKRIWSVDAASSAAGKTGSGLGSALFATGSDDYSVKLWSPSSPSAAACLDTGANVCSVRFNPWAPHYLAVGSAALAILLYDLRKAGGGSPPLARLQGHRKAVSCVRWLDSSQLVSASTDSSLRLWDVSGLSSPHSSALSSQGQPGPETGWPALTPALGQKRCTRDSSPGQNMGWGVAGGQEAPVGWGRLVRTYTGHVNERNFVGLAASEEVLAAGSETGEVCVYLKSTPTPCLCHKLCSSKPTVKHRPGSPAHFISSLTWHAGSHTLVAGNSGGDVWALDLQC